MVSTIAALVAAGKLRKLSSWRGQDGAMRTTHDFTLAERLEVLRSTTNHRRRARGAGL